MDITIDAATASIITAAIVGLISVVTTIIANKYSLRQLEIQWAIEEKRAILESENAQKIRETEFQKEKIRQLQEIYGNSISSLTTLLIYTDGAKRNQKDYVVNLGEAQKWLSLVVAYHYDKQGQPYKVFLDLYLRTQDGYHGYENIKKLREMVVDFVAKDHRLKILEK